MSRQPRRDDDAAASSGSEDEGSDGDYSDLSEEGEENKDDVDLSQFIVLAGDMAGLQFVDPRNFDCEEGSTWSRSLVAPPDDEDGVFTPGMLWECEGDPDILAPHRYNVCVSRVDDETFAVLLHKSILSKEGLENKKQFESDRVKFGHVVAAKRLQESGRMFARAEHISHRNEYQAFLQLHSSRNGKLLRRTEVFPGRRGGLWPLTMGLSSGVVDGVPLALLTSGSIYAGGKLVVRAIERSSADAAGFGSILASLSMPGKDIKSIPYSRTAQITDCIVVPELRKAILAIAGGELKVCFVDLKRGEVDRSIDLHIPECFPPHKYSDVHDRAIWNSYHRCGASTLHGAVGSFVAIWPGDSWGPVRPCMMVDRKEDNKENICAVAFASENTCVVGRDKWLRTFDLRYLKTGSGRIQSVNSIPILNDPKLLEKFTCILQPFERDRIFACAGLGMCQTDPPEATLKIVDLKKQKVTDTCVVDGPFGGCGRGRVCCLGGIPWSPSTVDGAVEEAGTRLEMLSAMPSSRLSIRLVNVQLAAPGRGLFVSSSSLL